MEQKKGIIIYYCLRASLSLLFNLARFFLFFCFCYCFFVVVVIFLSLFSVISKIYMHTQHLLVTSRSNLQHCNGLFAYNGCYYMT